MRAVFLDFGTVSNNDIDTTQLDASLPDLVYHDVTAANELKPRVSGAEIVLTNKIAITRDVIAASPELKLVVLAATGTNNVDIDAAREHGVAVYNIRAYCTESVVEHVFAAILHLTHRLGAYQQLLKSGAWLDSPQFKLLDYPIRELAGRNLVIVGYGELGRGVARIAEAFGMTVFVARRPGATGPSERKTLDELLPAADIVSLHCPLTPETDGVISAQRLSAMKPDALLINTARGALVDEQALADALRSGRIGGAAIDVLSEEPPISGNPLLADDIPNLLVTPHVAWASGEARQRAVDAMTANVEAFMRGDNTNRVC